ncbi:mitochondrial inner membrane protein OXA1L isoform X2 [Hemiscyllium ocellatum]|uniref:mitochondrial inner membrane protein OXA1L isoform X2 n=1 Tax=Hemiscyllium ocellatum TaxID=170820 RepID=UPI0029670460|nr:mitochondrial inner membrane protein OXA1L isoform X2 [Hemiscyllium ocellatum]
MAGPLRSRSAERGKMAGPLRSRSAERGKMAAVVLVRSMSSWRRMMQKCRSGAWSSGAPLCPLCQPALLGTAPGSRLVLPLPVGVRYNSAASSPQVSPSEEIAQSLASVPAALPSPPAELLDATLAQEAGLAELGLGGYTPVGLVQQILEFIHLEVGLPWWGAIVAGTVLARTLVFPVIVKGQREAAKLNNHLPEMTKLTNRMNEAKTTGNKFEFAKAYSDLMLFQKKHDVNPLRGFLVPLIQAPIFISFFVALRQMAYLPVPSLQTGGLWWFTDLTAADPFYLLPVVVTGTMWGILELGAESGVDNPNLRTMKAVFRIMPLVILPFTISFPTAVFTYWLTSNLYSLVQVAFLRLPAVRRKLQIPDRIKHDVSALPRNEGFLKSMKSGWKNAQAAQQLQERERRIKQHLDLAAKGPLRQTFAENPLQQKENTSSPLGRVSPSKKRPWEDTIG